MAKTITIADEAKNLELQIDYNSGYKISEVKINGKNTISPSGVYTSIKFRTNLFTFLDSKASVKLNVKRNKIEIGNIVFGDDKMRVMETWIFTINEKQIKWEIRRQYLQNGKLDDMPMPVWTFANLSTWKGGILNTGG